MGGYMPMSNIPKSGGYSIVELLMGVAISGAVLVLVNTFFTTAMSVHTHSNYKLDSRAAARTIAATIDCAATPTTCTLTNLVTIPKRGGGTLLANTGLTIISGWNVRALCTDPTHFTVQAAKITSSGVAAVDALTKKALDWNHPEAALFSSSTLCPTGGTGVAASSAALTVVAGVSCLVTTKAALPCNPAAPPACPAGKVSKGTSLDTFGGDEATNLNAIFGQTMLRYCQ